MNLSAATLCDFAQVREGLLFVSSGGITRLWRDELPAPMGTMLALLIELDPIEGERPHELLVHVMGEDGERVSEIQGSFQVGQGTDVAPWEKVNVPITVDLRLVALPGHGRYEVGVYLDGNHHRSLSFLVAPPPAG